MKDTTILISSNMDKQIRKTLDEGGKVKIGSVGVLSSKKWPSRKAYHNFSGKKVTIAGYRKIIFTEQK